MINYLKLYQSIFSFNIIFFFAAFILLAQVIHPHSVLAADPCPGIIYCENEGTEKKCEGGDNAGESCTQSYDCPLGTCKEYTTPWQRMVPCTGTYGSCGATCDPGWSKIGGSCYNPPPPPPITASCGGGPACASSQVCCNGTTCMTSAECSPIDIPPPLPNFCTSDSQCPGGCCDPYNSTCTYNCGGGCSEDLGVDTAIISVRFVSQDGDGNTISWKGNQTNDGIRFRIDSIPGEPDTSTFSVVNSADPATGFTTLTQGVPDQFKTYYSNQRGAVLNFNWSLNRIDDSMNVSLVTRNLNRLVTAQGRCGTVSQVAPLAYQDDVWSTHMCGIGRASGWDVSDQTLNDGKCATQNSGCSTGDCKIWCKNDVDGCVDLVKDALPSYMSFEPSKPQSAGTDDTGQQTIIRDFLLKFRQDNPGIAIKYDDQFVYHAKVLRKYGAVKDFQYALVYTPPTGYSCGRIIGYKGTTPYDFGYLGDAEKASSVMPIQPDDCAVDLNGQYLTGYNFVTIVLEKDYHNVCYVNVGGMSSAQINVNANADVSNYSIDTTGISNEDREGKNSGITRMWLQKQGAVAFTPPPLFQYSSTMGFLPVVTADENGNPLYYYNWYEVCASQNDMPCSFPSELSPRLWPLIGYKTAYWNDTAHPTEHLPLGTYYASCDMPYGARKCTGDPMCVVNGGTLACEDWASCANPVGEGILEEIVVRNNKPMFRRVKVNTTTGETVSQISAPQQGPFDATKNGMADTLITSIGIYDLFDRTPPVSYFQWWGTDPFGRQSMTIKQVPYINGMPDWSLSGAGRAYPISFFNLPIPGNPTEYEVTAYSTWYNSKKPTQPVKETIWIATSEGLFYGFYRWVGIDAAGWLNYADVGTWTRVSDAGLPGAAASGGFSGYPIAGMSNVLLPTADPNVFGFAQTLTRQSSVILPSQFLKYRRALKNWDGVHFGGTPGGGEVVADASLKNSAASMLADNMAPEPSTLTTVNQGEVAGASTDKSLVYACTGQAYPQNRNMINLGSISLGDDAHAGQASKVLQIFQQKNLDVLVLQDVFYYADNTQSVLNEIQDAFEAAYDPNPMYFYSQTVFNNPGQSMLTISKFPLGYTGSRNIVGQRTTIFSNIQLPFNNNEQFTVWNLQLPNSSYPTNAGGQCDALKDLLTYRQSQASALPTSVLAGSFNLSWADLVTNPVCAAILSPMQFPSMIMTGCEEATCDHSGKDFVVGAYPNGPKIASVCTENTGISALSHPAVYATLQFADTPELPLSDPIIASTNCESSTKAILTWKASSNAANYILRVDSPKTCLNAANETVPWFCQDSTTPTLGDRFITIPVTSTLCNATTGICSYELPLDSLTIYDNWSIQGVLGSQLTAVVNGGPISCVASFTGDGNVTYSPQLGSFYASTSSIGEIYYGPGKTEVQAIESHYLPNTLSDFATIQVTCLPDCTACMPAGIPDGCGAVCPVGVLNATLPPVITSVDSSRNAAGYRDYDKLVITWEPATTTVPGALTNYEILIYPEKLGLTPDQAYEQATTNEAIRLETVAASTQIANLTITSGSHPYPSADLIVAIRGVAGTCLDEGYESAGYTEWSTMNKKFTSTLSYVYRLLAPDINGCPTVSDAGTLLDSSIISASDLRTQLTSEGYTYIPPTVDLLSMIADYLGPTNNTNSESKNGFNNTFTDIWVHPTSWYGTVGRYSLETTTDLDALGLAVVCKVPAPTSGTAYSSPTKSGIVDDFSNPQIVIYLKQKSLPWWQAKGGNLWANSGAITSIIPFSCNSDANCSPNLVTNLQSVSGTSGIPVATSTIKVKEPTSSTIAYFSQTYNASAPQIPSPQTPLFSVEQFLSTVDDFLLAHSSQRSTTEVNISSMPLNAVNDSSINQWLADTANGLSIDGKKIYVLQSNTDKTLYFSDTDKLAIGANQQVIIIVKGNLTLGVGAGITSLTQAITVADGGYLEIVATGDISIDSALGTNPTGLTAAAAPVPTLEGVYIAGGNLVINGKGNQVDNQFVGKGTFAGLTGVGLNRTFTDIDGQGPLNDSLPVELFIHHPPYVLSTPTFILKPELQYQEEQ